MAKKRKVPWPSLVTGRLKTESLLQEIATNPILQSQHPSEERLVARAEERRKAAEVFRRLALGQRLPSQEAVVDQVVDEALGKPKWPF